MYNFCNRLAVRSHLILAPHHSHPAPLPMESALFSSSPLSAFVPRSPPSLASRPLRLLSLPFSLLIHHSPPPRGGPPLLPRRLLRRFSPAAYADADAAAASAAESRSSGDRVVARPSSELRMGRPGGSGTGVAGDEKLRSLRELFARPDVAIDAYIIPSQDAHQSEFIAECFMRRAYLTGFTGSAGTAVVTKEKAALWTDGRYFLQAEKQLSPDWILMRSGNQGVPTTSEWLNDVLPAGCRIGIDPFLFSHDAAEELKEAISKKNHELILIKDFNLVDEIWKSRPKPPGKPTRVHDIKYAGVDVLSKLSSLRSVLVENGCTAIVISMLDEVAWLLNMRGSDVPNSPVFYSYLIVEISHATLFVDNNKVTPGVLDHLKSAGVELKPYEEILSEVESLAAKGAKLWLDTSCVNAAIVSIFRSACERHFTRLATKSRKQLNNGASSDLISIKSEDIRNGIPNGLYKVSPVAIAKAVKNKAEIEGMKNSHLRDAAALSEFWCWMEQEVKNNLTLTEVAVADKLFEFRKQQEGFIDTSFDTISGYGANGAVIHYKPTSDSCSFVGTDNLFLLDSGGQYVDGTTDITRTVHFGEPSAWQKECFTRVLQGHIALDQAIFPERMPGFVLDVLARSSLWKVGLDYRHGTGHGVGAALNVHEGPQSISFRFGNLTALQNGMIVSNEPGYYEDHSFGIRIENLLLVKEVDLPNSYGGIGFLGFEKLTFVPIQSKLIDTSLLSPMEIKWVNDYHSQVWEKVSPLVNVAVRDWLWRNTSHAACWTLKSRGKMRTQLMSTCLILSISMFARPIKQQSPPSYSFVLEPEKSYALEVKKRVFLRINL
ncbi:probable Xaa-Pro aminopeptidase P isoform X5 [Ananas comosus]|uniref:Probable Xaa-Pro aminopeptidase P isoform X5 n=1 Tax=Ananas comosus TaxID=4615 RepID=A0A6P5FJC1_ANACO|nr:probable Xaa-Pro aminopeptidase P isoform X5 [Ananas comosus]